MNSGMHLIRPVRQTSRAGPTPQRTAPAGGATPQRTAPVPQRTVDVPTAVAAVQNEKFPKNKKQQDAYFAVEDLASVTNCAALRGLGCYGVADGHGEHGEHVAAAVCTKLPEQLAAAGLADLERGDVQAALKAAFCAVDADLRSGEPWSTTLHKSGCTFCCVLADAEQLHVAWAGDCAAVLVNEDGQEALTQDHRVGVREDEHARVVAAGAVVEKMADNKKRWGVPGGPGFLEATRAFGDWWGKQETEEGKSTALTAEPEVRTIKRGMEQRYLAIGSDGVFGFIGASEVAACLRVPLGRATPNLQSRVSHVLEVALAKGSNDNCCLVATDLRYKRDSAIRRPMGLLTNAKSPEKTRAALAAANRSDSPPRPPSPKSPKSAAPNRELPTSPTKPDVTAPGPARRNQGLTPVRDGKKGPAKDALAKKLPVRKGSQEESAPSTETSPKKENVSSATPNKRVPVDRSKKQPPPPLAGTPEPNALSPKPPAVEDVAGSPTALEVAAVKTAETAKLRAELDAVNAELAAAKEEVAAVKQEAAAAQEEAAAAKTEAAAAKQSAAAAAQLEAAATKQEAAAAAQELASVGGQAAERQQQLAATNAELKQLAQQQVADATARAEAAEAAAAEAKQEAAALAQQAREAGGLASRATEHLREREEELRAEMDRAAEAHAAALAMAQEEARLALQTAADEASVREEALLAEVEAAAGAAQKAMHAAQAQGEHDDQVRNELQRQAQQSAAQAAAYMEKATQQEQALREEMENQASELDRLRGVEAELRAQLAAAEARAEQAEARAATVVTGSAPSKESATSKESAVSKESETGSR